MIRNIYTRAFNILKAKPFRLWGLSLLGGFLSALILLAGLLPIITIPVVAVLNAGLAVVYLDGYNGKEVYSDQLFEGFKNFLRVAGGMCWKKLWILLWFLIPIAGPFIAVAKSFAYAFTPYILMREPNVSATEALRKSMIDTRGYRLNMFGAVIIVPAAYFIVSLVLSLLALIPFAGIVFRIIAVIVAIAYSVFAPLFIGLVRAGFYEYAKKPVSSAYSYKPSVAAATDGEQIICGVCGTENTSDKKFCAKCGAKL
ncbi:MAG: zinc ribbon domain-containing protein [Clostridia bacterium]|nr:zinc ribbon domain-containing protein [Clostridia bacterium]